MDSNRILTGSHPSQSGSNLRFPRFLLGRLYLLAAILTLDCALLAITPHAAPLLGPLAPCGIVSFAVFLGLGYRRLQASRLEIFFRPIFLLIHVLLVNTVALGDRFAEHSPASWLNSSTGLLLSGAVLVAGIGILALACIPFSVWIKTAAIPTRPGNTL